MNESPKNLYSGKQQYMCKQKELIKNDKRNEFQIPRICRKSGNRMHGSNSRRGRGVRKMFEASSVLLVVFGATSLGFAFIHYRISRYRKALEKRAE